MIFPADMPVELLRAPVCPQLDPAGPRRRETEVELANRLVDLSIHLLLLPMFAIATGEELWTELPWDGWRESCESAQIGLDAIPFETVQRARLASLAAPPESPTE